MEIYILISCIFIIYKFTNELKTKRYKCDFSYHGKRFYFKYWNTIEEAVYNRKIAEEYFGIETLKKNPLAKQYIDLLTEEQKRLIENYVYNKIS